MYPQLESARPVAAPALEAQRAHGRCSHWRAFLNWLVAGSELVRRVSPAAPPVARYEWEKREAYARDLFRQRF